jgi:hypothetical protein
MLTNVGEGLLQLRGLLKFFFHNLASVRKAAVSIVAQVLKLTTSVGGRP